jgi:serine/threonine protein kinase
MLYGCLGDKSIVTELFPTTLMAHIYRSKEKMPEGRLISNSAKRSAAHVRQAALQIAGAIKIMHQHNFIHRDIKSENVLLRVEEGGLTMKLCDFGSTIKHKSKDKLREQCPIGTYFCIAPELLACLPYTRTVDIWSLGITMLEILDNLAFPRRENPKEFFKDRLTVFNSEVESYDCKCSYSSL